MSLVRNIGTFLQNGGLGTVGTNIFCEEMPADPADAVMVVSNISPEPDKDLNTKTQMFDVWVRNQSTKTASDIQEAVMEFLHRQHHITLGDYYVYTILAAGNIENLGKDIEHRSLQKVSYKAIYIDYRTVS